MSPETPAPPRSQDAPQHGVGRIAMRRMFYNHAAGYGYA
jgi:hypothetical protein